MAKKIDLQALRQQINELQIDKDLKHDLLATINDKQRYGLVWEESSEEAWDEMQDKLPVFVEDTTKRLDSAPEGSPNHVLIEGDNLNALAALTYAYAGKIDVIYIDPPYNTGNKDFIYNDSFVDKEDGYRHSKWTSFMNRRLKIAKQLLSEKGVIFISIDEHEVAPLRLLGDKIFSEKNFVGQWNWFKSSTPPALSKKIKRTIEYVLCWKTTANDYTFQGTRKVSKSNDPFTKPQNTFKILTFPADSITCAKKDGVLRAGVYGTSKFPNELLDDLVIENGKNVNEVRFKNRFIWLQDTLDKNIDEGLYIELSAKGVLSYKRSNYSPEVPPNFIDSNVGVDTTENAGRQLQEIFGETVFDYPKPVSLIKYLINFTPSKDSTILDFFAGSGTTLHATMQLNSEDGGHRKCILVTNNENNICEKVTYERNKRVINGYTNQKGEEVPGLTHNNLRYYKTEFVPRDQSSSKSRRALMASLVDLLCIKNNIYQEQETFGGKKFKKSVLRYYKDEAGQMLVVLDERVVSIVIPMIAEVATKQNPLKVYVYSDGAYAYEDEFHKVMPVIELCAMPDAFLQALEGGTDILPKQKYSEAMMKEFQQNEALAMQNEEVVKEALSDDYDYVLKEKEDNVTNDIID